MAITTYAQLQTAIGTWSHRSDTSTIAPECIALAEARLADLLILKSMETETTLTGVVGSDLLALPSGYVSPICLWIELDNARIKLEPALPSEFDGTPTNTIPQYWAINGSNIQLDNPVNDTYSFPFRYVGTSNLSVSNTTNYLLTKRPDLYLAASMAEFARYARDAEMHAAWEAKFQKAVQEVKASDNRNRAIAPLRMECIGGRSNIFTG